MSAQTRTTASESLKTGALIGRAKGILMGRREISWEAPVELLCRGAERLKTELRQLTRRIVQGEEGNRGPNRLLPRRPGALP